MFSSSSNSWKQDDPRIRPVPPSSYAWTPIPRPASPDAIVAVSCVPTSRLIGPGSSMSVYAREGEKEEVPCFAYLIEKGGEAILFDLGLREDPWRSTKVTVDYTLKEWEPIPGPGPIARLRLGGYELCRLKLVVLSHSHFDHCGDLDTLPFPPPPILVGPGTLKSTTPGYPIDPDGIWFSKWFKTFDLVELPSANKAGEWEDEVARLGPGAAKGKRRWQPVGCFDKGVDWFGDGSLWFIDAPGHCTGHICALARTTASPPSYILLSGDAAHSQHLFLPVPTSSPTKEESMRKSDIGSEGKNPTEREDLRSPKPVINGQVQLAQDPERATWTVGQLTRMSAEPDVMVLLAHEKEVEGLLPLWPKALNRWMEQGWKERKERGVEGRAKKWLGQRER